MDKVAITDGGCWLWKGAFINGWPEFWLGHRKAISARRFAYAKWVGELAPGESVKMTCGRRTCVSPEHMRVVSG